MREKVINDLLRTDPAEGLEIAWSNTDLSLAEKARVISSLHMRSRMTLEGSARMTGATPAQIQALLELATLEDDDLEMVSMADPPATTWLLFANAESDALHAGIKALSQKNPSSEHALLKVYNAMRAASGPNQDERIGAISAQALRHLFKKAKQYEALSKKSQGFLVSLARRKDQGLSITEKQLPWFTQILLDLVKAKVITRKSSDGDQEICDEVLNALGV